MYIDVSMMLHLSHGVYWYNHYPVNVFEQSIKVSLDTVIRTFNDNMRRLLWQHFQKLLPYQEYEFRSSTSSLVEIHFFLYLPLSLSLSLHLVGSLPLPLYFFFIFASNRC